VPWRAVSKQTLLLRAHADEAKLSSCSKVWIERNEKPFPVRNMLGLAGRSALALAFAGRSGFLSLDATVASLGPMPLPPECGTDRVLGQTSQCLTLCHPTTWKMRFVSVTACSLVNGDRPDSRRMTIDTAPSASGEAEIAAIKAEIARRTHGDLIERDANSRKAVKGVLKYLYQARVEDETHDRNCRRSASVSRMKATRDRT